MKRSFMNYNVDFTTTYLQKPYADNDIMQGTYNNDCSAHDTVWC